MNQANQAQLNISKKGFDRFNPNVQAKADDRLLEQLHEHPGSAGKMFESMRTQTPQVQDSIRSTKRF